MEPQESMSSTSTIHMQPSTNKFQRRPSFWKTPMPRDNLKTGATKRNYSQMSDGPNAGNESSNSHNNCQNPNPVNPTKKRRILSDQEIISLAKEGSFNPSSIILAVEDADTGFCWFKRISSNSTNSNLSNLASNPTSNSNSTSNPLRELSRKEVAHRKSEGPNERNRQQAAKVAEQSKIVKHTKISKISKMAKSRRFTAPPAVLRAIAEHSEQTEHI